MAGVRRTRAEKERAQIHRQDAVTYSFSSKSSAKLAQVKAAKGEAKAATFSITDLFDYDVRLIYQDLFKTILITGVILAAVVGLRFGLG